MSLQYAKYRYREHKKGAGYRNIPFKLTFEEWYSWWLAHGVDRNIPRANNGNTLCMCRYNDTGAYELGNIYCASKQQNTQDAHKNNRFIKGHRKKISTPFGIFESKASAAKALNVHTTTISTRLVKQPNDYFYL